MSRALEAQSLNNWTAREVPEWQNSSLTSAQAFSVFSRFLTRVVEVTELQRHEKHMRDPATASENRDSNATPAGSTHRSSPPGDQKKKKKEKHMRLTTRHCRVKGDNTRPHRVFTKRDPRGGPNSRHLQPTLHSSA